MGAYTCLEEQLFGVLGAVAQVCVSWCVPVTISVLEQIRCMQQDGVQRVNAHTTSYQQQVHHRVRRLRVKVEIPSHPHCYLRAHRALKRRTTNRNLQKKKKSGEWSLFWRKSIK